MAQINLDRIAAQVEKLMVDTLTIKRVIGTTYDEITMENTSVYSTIYSGIGFVVPMGDPAGTRLGGEDVQRIQYEIAIPETAAEILPNDVVEVLTSSDPSLVASGGVIYVHDQIPTTFLTHRRIKAFKDKSAV